MDLNVLGIDECHDRIKSKLTPDLVVNEERLSNGSRIGESRCLDQDVVEFVASAHEIAKNAD